MAKPNQNPAGEPAPVDNPPVPPNLGLADALAVMDPDPPTEMDKILEILLDPKNINQLTELSKSEITAFSVLATMRKRHTLPVLSDFLKENLVFRVSKSRSGRKEFSKIMSRQLQLSEQQEALMEPTGMRRWFGRRGGGKPNQ
jgi:hypothetical protein